MEELDPIEDHEAAADDDRERGDHPGRHRSPPEVERLRAALAEDQEAADQADVRRVEDVATAEAKDVLGEQRGGGGAGVEVPAVCAPPIAVLRAR